MNCGEDVVKATIHLTQTMVERSISPLRLLIVMCCSSACMLVRRDYSA